MKLRQCVERHEREHVMLHMVVHVPVDESAHWIHVNGPAVQAVVEDILGQTGMLGRVVNDHQPSAEEMRQDDQKYGNPALERHRSHNGCQIKSHHDPRVAPDFWKFAFGDVSPFGLGDTSSRMLEKSREVALVNSNRKQREE